MATTTNRWSDESLAATHAAVATIRQRPKITVLPPGPHRPELETKQYLSTGSRFPVSTTFSAGGEAESTGLGFPEYQRMRTFNRKLDNHRHKERPSWSVNDQQLAKVLATAMEARSGFGK